MCLQIQIVTIAKSSDGLFAQLNIWQNFLKAYIPDVD